ncbi:MAG: high frequency lysogenization protein HflD [Pseudomonadales bacterium]|nr:high frequency lysogenization protein HflD [Pseudomonadales bacterium]MDP7358286.1 high frequency lysogenization protein HflD [Pseudomonadales bacterium]MDP7597767.1 high frequency lysogenization protein HflD [Pseudomonadales bacterium]HJN52346.1 high frequency lysogenization protein HflD [Pseudomonadales bacterium]
MSDGKGDQALALAGLIQAASLVAQVAKTGLLPQDSFEACVTSLFSFDPASTSEVYGGLQGLNLGLRTAHEILTSGGLTVHGEVLRYSLNLYQLERQLTRRVDILERIAAGLRNSRKLADQYSPVDEKVLASIGTLYTDTISTIGNRIQVTGDVRHLQNSNNTDKVRVLLLAGIRSTVLWHQLGGRWWHLLLQRQRLKADISHYLKMH